MPERQESKSEGHQDERYRRSVKDVPIVLREVPGERCEGGCATKDASGIVSRREQRWSSNVTAQRVLPYGSAY